KRAQNERETSARPDKRRSKALDWQQLPNWRIVVRPTRSQPVPRRTIAFTAATANTNQRALLIAITFLPKYQIGQVGVMTLCALLFGAVRCQPRLQSRPAGQPTNHRPITSKLPDRPDATR